MADEKGGCPLTAAVADGAPPSMEVMYAQLVEDVVEALTAREGDAGDGRGSATPRQYWVGIVGAPASGKSTTAREVARQLWEEKGITTAVIPMDGYHFYRRELDAMPDPAALHARRGAHWTFNGAKFVQDLTQARATRTGLFPSFDHHVGDPIENDIALTRETSVVLVEGNYLSLPMEPWSQLKELFDERWLISCDASVARSRVIARHVSTGNTLEQATRRADENDVPNGDLVEVETRRTGWATRVVEGR